MHQLRQHQRLLLSLTSSGASAERLITTDRKWPTAKAMKLTVSIEQKLQRQTPMDVAPPFYESARLDSVNEFVNIDRHAVRRSDRGPV